METSENTRLIKALNRMLAKEHACAIRYATHAVLVNGPYAESVCRRFQEIASDETVHAELLRRRICALGGTPTMEVDGGPRCTDGTLAEMIKTNVLEERESIETYSAILENIPGMNILLHRTVEGILKDEQEHLEELLRLEPLKEETPSTETLDVPLEDRELEDRSPSRTAGCFGIEPMNGE